ncbi:beta-ketoacyl-[acyl-carrier-protein] synthase family protein [Pelomonas aquatica]|jgi:3-oxoacyl-(acyl-carrier-protein) synthase|uniref:Nodulation protein E n=1 Tax=Pelomonas aquatica TaxID=431058 RepID=A0A9X4R9L2_9BURK|nr:beta-ketoacyl-[acyl-carrier-protein] synthase family protein [Pelomonas aquatica]MCY4752825.1 beta-ketoacyl-[acyl-carrier-protein] synthase family protein [Pelomonas aquatica]MDG0864478.1 beta-ketoacyl-[acyl-carrier-protein] synthase family protein [Pelomonas aquatica]
MTRVWITGLGAVSALGQGADALADALLAGRSGVAAQPGSEEHALRPYAAAAVTVPLAAGMPPAQRNLYDRHGLLALEAAAEAWAQAGLPATATEPDRAAVAWGTGLGGSTSMELSYTQMFTARPPRVHPYTVVRVMANSAASHLAMRHQLRAAQLAVSNACASSAQAIGEALWLLRNGRADIALVGGSEAMLHIGSALGWQAMGVMAPLDAEAPEQSCRPFDDARKGLVLGEGAAALVIETEAHARARGAAPLAILAGYGHSVDAVHLSRPDAAGQARAMAAALRDAGLAPADIGYINAHGTATEVGDAVEAESIGAVFGTRAVPVSATKALHGHLIGAGGALELVATVQALRRQALPPSAHVRSSQLNEQVDIVTGSARAATLRAAMSNSFAFGGSNVALVTTLA